MAIENKTGFNNGGMPSPKYLDKDFPDLASGFSQREVVSWL